VKQFYVESLLDSTALPADKALLAQDTRLAVVPAIKGSQMDTNRHIGDITATSADVIKH
jgi:hypothetical protein